MQGLNPSHHLKMKTSAQYHEPAQEIVLVAEKICINFERRYKLFKRCLAIQYPFLPVPSQKNPFLHYLNIIFIQAVHLPKCILCAEQTVRFNGACGMKQRIMFKNMGDRLQVDTLCSNRYTSNFYFRQQPAPNKCINREYYAPLHVIV